MSAEAVSAALDTAALRRAGYRIAFGVTGSFAVAEAMDWDFTFVGPMLAAQILIKLRRPPSLGQGIGLLAVVAVTNLLVLLLSTALVAAPAVLIMAIGLLFCLTTYAQFRGAPDLVTLLLQIAAVTLPVFAVVSPETASGFAETLFQAACVALVAVWAAFAVFPAPDDPAVSAKAPSAAPLEPADAARVALRNTLVLLPVLMWYILDASQVAVVVLITIVTVLRQSDPRQGSLVAGALVLGNLVGGLASALAYNLVVIGNSLLSFVLVCLTASLLFAGRIVMGGRSAPIVAVAFATFILLLGLGLSPVPGGSGEAFIGRLVNVLLAAAYTVGALALLDGIGNRSTASLIADNMPPLASKGTSRGLD